MIQPSQEIESWYENYFGEKGRTRHDILIDRGVLFQHLAWQASFYKALSKAKLERKKTRVLEVGCGHGDVLATFLQINFIPSNLFGVDIQEKRIATARFRYPHLAFECNDASSICYPDNHFDLVFESGMFVQVRNPSTANGIAAEMLRVCKAGGYILLMDWRYSKPGSDFYVGLSTRKIRRLFHLGTNAKLLSQTNGPLVPPVGRFLSKHMPSAYFLVSSLLPFVVGFKTTLLQKK